MQPATALEAPSLPPRAVMVPWLDAAAIGGASLIAIPLLAMLLARPLPSSNGVLVLLGVLFNWPHFIASYRLLYATSDSVRRHRAASVYVPAALAAYAVLAIAVWPLHPLYANILAATSGVYLARHYTGQAWGMMASFSHVAGTPFSAAERRLFRLDVNLLMVWHGLWATRQSIRLIAPSIVDPVSWLYDRTLWLPAVALVVGLAGVVRFRGRNGALPAARVLLPWLAIHVWYVAIARNPGALFAVQIAHAMQYLIFPLRVEMNRADPRPAVDWRKSALFLAVWILLGLAVFEGIEPLFRVAYQLAGGQGPLPAVVSSVLISGIAIHHYFIDGALYKLRNPEVRRHLFAHLGPPRR
jgi:hypothetical protein